MKQDKGGHVHAFLLDNGTDLTLIDTLFHTDARQVLERIGSIGRSIRDLKRILLTHGHRSHLGGLATLKRLSGATVYSHEWEADIIAGERTA
jgi:glyoxylase-like metal-dependent hydrolase (beta-lactamase superfamily II)